MSPAQRAMTTWVGALASSGVLEPSKDVAAGEALAAYVVGQARLAELKAYFAEASSEAVQRERRAAVEAIIGMARADREVHPEERHLLKQIVGWSGLDEDTQDELVMQLHDSDASADGLGERLTHPVLRELMLALAWELALADGRIDVAETDFYGELARELEVSDRRARAIANSVAARLP